jgi:hypothetical protein
MSQHRIEADESGLFVNRGGLDECDLVTAQALAHEIEAARQRSIAERSPILSRRRRRNDSDE